MSLADFQALFDRLEEDLELVDFSFAGDPLLNPDLFDMIAHVRAAQVDVNIHTNSLALDEERAAALTRCGADIVVINLNTLTRNGEYHPRIIADFHPVRVERVQRYLRLNAKTRTQVVLQLIAPPGEPHLSSKELEEVFTLPRNAVFRLKPERDCSYDAQPPSGDGWRCYRLHQDICVSPKGDLVICCWDTLLRTSQGNLLRDDPTVIWRDRMNQVRGGCPTALCHNCKDNQLGAVKMLANDLCSPSWAYRVFRLFSGRGF